MTLFYVHGVSPGQRQSGGDLTANKTGPISPLCFFTDSFGSRLKKRANQITMLQLWVVKPLNVMFCPYMIAVQNLTRGSIWYYGVRMPGGDLPSDLCILLDGVGCVIPSGHLVWVRSGCGAHIASVDLELRFLTGK